MPKNIEEFWEVNAHHTKQLDILRNTLLHCGLIETFKWSFPTYTLKNKNIVSIGSFKEHYALWFFQGVFLSDHETAIQCTRRQNQSNAALEIHNGRNRHRLSKDVCARSHRQSEKRVRSKKATRHELHYTTRAAGSTKPKHISCRGFYNLTKGKQKEYANYITDAKEEKTRLKRMDKIIPMILAGKGLNDRYN